MFTHEAHPHGKVMGRMFSRVYLVPTAMSDAGHYYYK